MSNRLYNILKLLTTVVLPGTATLYVALAPVWSFPGEEKVSATATGLITFLGLLITHSTIKYNKQQVNTIDGDLVVTSDPDTDDKYLSLGVKQSTFDQLSTKDQVKLNVVQNAPPAQPEQ